MDILPVSIYEYVALFLLCLVSFLIGWFSRGKRSDPPVIKDERPVTDIDLDITKQKTAIRAVQTRKRGGIAVTNGSLHHEPDSDHLSFVPDKMEIEVHELPEEPVIIPEKKDDLKQINGIGSTIEKKLNEIGVYTLLQISEFTQKDVEKVARHLETYPRKIEKEQWIEQARTLVNGLSR